jgi:hypothetical protein
MLIVEVNGGYCRKPFECDFLPRSSYSSLFLDITNVEAKPDEFWRYDYQSKQFYEPSGDVNDISSEYAIRVKWNDVRNQRQIFLLESDWTQLPDCFLPRKEKLAWKKYRQELRDLPQKYAHTNPVFVVFPIKPTHIIQRTFWQKIVFVFNKIVRGK